MARPSKLSPEQWSEVMRRHAAGEGVRALAREYGVDESTVRAKVNPQSPQVRAVAQKLADAHRDLAELPIPQQYMAVSLAEQLRSLSKGYMLAAEVATRTGYRAHSLANAEMQRVDDSAPLSPESVEALKHVAVLTKIGNDALVPASNLLAANKDAIKGLNDQPAQPKIDPGRMSSAALEELLAARINAD
jgi:hypothetical protein